MTTLPALRPSARIARVIPYGCGRCAYFERRSGKGVAGVHPSADGRCAHPCWGKAEAARRPWQSETDYCERFKRGRG